MEYITLSELSSLIRTVIQSTLYDYYWVRAEIAQINFHYNSGHCYLDLVEKQEHVIIAKMRATIWACNFSQISANFKSLTGQDIQAGMKILMLAQVNYHEVHGLSLNIKEIDPSYTLGEMMLKRREIIERLTKEGIISNNKLIHLPPVIQKIAVISAEGAAGYGDFQSRLKDNPYGYRFHHKLFQAYMQGEKAEQSIITALEKCIRQRKHFDAVVIIRGGGSAIDLHCFDSYPLAKVIALSPLPVFTGIGHERDETVADHVANKRLITPTAVAEFLITAAKAFEDSIDDLKHSLIIRTRDLMENEKHYLKTSADIFLAATRNYLTNIKIALRDNIRELQTRAIAALNIPSIRIRDYEGNLRKATDGLIGKNHQKIEDFRKVLNVYPSHMISIQTQKLANYEIKSKLLDPQNVLTRGYSITYLNGKALKDTGYLRKDDIINTRLSSGFITSVVEYIEGEKRDE
jgi:exodeoxyribonuclease VII large subunit